MDHLCFALGLGEMYLWESFQGVFRSALYQIFRSSQQLIHAAALGARVSSDSAALAGEHNCSATEETEELKAVGPDLPANVLREPKNTHKLLETLCHIGRPSRTSPT